jgi:hypothetical protein
LFGYTVLLDRLPDLGGLHDTLSEVYAVDPAGVHVGRLFEDGGGSPVTVHCAYIDLDGGEFPWMAEINTDDTVTRPTEVETVAALARRFALRALLPIEDEANEEWLLITAEQIRKVALDLDELHENRYVVGAERRT